MSMFDGRKLIVHEKLKDFHSKATCPTCCDNGCTGDACLIYVSCGDFEPDMDRRCHYPCRYCLVWSGYGWEGRDIDGLIEVLTEKALLMEKP